MEDERMINLPNEFEEKMKALLGDEFEDYIKCYDQPRYYGLRVNTEKISVEDFVKICPFEITPIPWIDNGFYYDGEKISPAKHPYYFAGLYYLQEPSAMTPANRLPVEPGDRVLDVCAAPGGKATELGAKLQNEGVLVANDISSSRARGLLKNLEVFGIGNMLVMSEEPGRLERYFSGYFDKILIDAPCSGEGMFRKDKKMVRAWEEHGPEFFSKLQKSIITQAARMLKPGGMMLYSTCTFDPLENEGTIESFLRRHPEFSLDPELALPGIPCQGGMAHLYPHQVRGEGHFLARLRKRGEERAELAELPVDTGEARWEAFAREALWEAAPRRLRVQGEWLYAIPEGMPDVRGLNVLRAGVQLGRLAKGRLEPAHALALSLAPGEAKEEREVSREEALRYLGGEVLEGEMRGWGVLRYRRCALGWGKGSGGQIKNHYPKGLRWR